ncbi:type II secretion system F family protein [Candidatus Micrarchaeota archaeon]|nr:type II secretion system F family protein [Candidatus Micrarchaeota archaeon]MBU1165383.1 type II secretion system F family protein [Candidatus Micrarchaeota archaeon]MBU1886218.1 type II secretion system F family protein [Candidatus Micrarchaeota archaeon]
MTNESTVFERAGRLFFTRSQIRDLEKQVNGAGIGMPTDAFAGYVGINIIIITIFLTFIIVLYPPLSSPIAGMVSNYIEVPFALIALIIFIGCMIVVYLGTMAILSTYLIMKSEDRREKLENVLPDFLVLVASNLKAGMALDQAMWYSAKPEFGLLAVEVKSIVKGAFSGENMVNTLDHLAARFDSKVFNRTILLIKQANATGGALTDVLERTADDVRNTLIMKKEIAASLVLYEIFVLFAATIGTPFLFAVASKLIEIFEKITPRITGIQTSAGGPFATFSNMKFGGAMISSSDFFWFSIPTIFVTALISSFIVSVIRTGSKNQGMKYFPFVLVVSYLIYWVVSSMVDSFFSTIG